MAELKTRRNNLSTKAFIDAVPDAGRHRDCRTVMAMMRKIAASRPRMWGDSIVGFGTYRYRYRNGQHNEWMLTGFSPRKQNLTIYIMPGFSVYQALLQKLGRHRTGKSCLYIKSLADVDTDIVAELIARSVADMQAMES